MSVPLVLSPRGVRTHYVSNAPMNAWIHVTLLTSLTKAGAPYVLELLREINTAASFARFVVWCVLSDFIPNGSFLVMDGAKIHFAEEVEEELSDFLELHE